MEIINASYCLIPREGSFEPDTSVEVGTDQESITLANV